MKAKHLLLAAVLLLSGVSAVPTSFATSCDARSTGAGDESAQCTFNCDSDDKVHAHASVDDNGDVQVSASCGSAYASCSDNDGACNSGWSSSTADTSTVGLCDGSGNGGWYTNFYIACSTSSTGSLSLATANSASTGLIDDLLEDFDPAQGLTPALEAALTPLDGTSAWMIGSGGTVSGYTCEAGAGCVSIITACEVDGEAWSCRVA